MVKRIRFTKRRHQVYQGRISSTHKSGDKCRFLAFSGKTLSILGRVFNLVQDWTTGFREGKTWDLTLETILFLRTGLLLGLNDRNFTLSRHRLRTRGVGSPCSGTSSNPTLPTPRHRSGNPLKNTHTF